MVDQVDSYIIIWSSTLHTPAWKIKTKPNPRPPILSSRPSELPTICKLSTSQPLYLLLPIGPCLS